MEFDKFSEIREKYCITHVEVTEGKMMSSPAMHYKKKVFAFFSKSHTMVFKLGKDFPIETLDIALSEFSPFKTKKPFRGWYQASFEDHGQWETLTELALHHIQQDV